MMPGAKCAISAVEHLALAVAKAAVAASISAVVAVPETSTAAAQAWADCLQTS
ncbi:MAG: hypothetical protein JWN00_391 [Actinomycetia bacterium]|nr:hypothetical protein [Actinomycetes bacterium]